MSKDRQLSQLEQDALGKAINTALEMEMAFKLYSFRVIGHDQFMARVQDLCDFMHDNSKK